MGVPFSLTFYEIQYLFKNTGTYKMKTEGIVATVSFPLMKLIIETKFNLFKTFELC